jgi:hypothetical protein
MEHKSAYTVKVDDSGKDNYLHRVFVGTPSTGLVRMEWVMGRYGQVIPMNWSQVQIVEFVSGYVPLRYTVDNAQNLIVQAALENGAEWLFLLEHDVILPPDAFIKLNQYMRDATIPVISGLYYYRSRPSEPLIFRGRGNGAFVDFELGEMVWADGVPTGCLLIHSSILKAMWEESPEYQVIGPRFTRRVFHSPRDIWNDPETGELLQMTGTSDLAWCERVMKDGYFTKAGWPEYEDKEFPFLVDTSIFCKHIDMDGTQYP